MQIKTYGIDVNALTRAQYTGVERYVFELIRELMKKPLYKNERVFLYSSAIVKNIGELPDGWEWKILNLPLLKKGWTHLRLSFELFVNPPSVFFSPAHEIPLFHRKSKIVNTIHDIAFVHVPEVYTFFAQARQRWAIKRAIKLSNHILTVSYTTKNDLNNYYSVNQAMMTVARLGVSHRKNFLNSDHGSYFLTLGRIEKKKNIEFLIKVFERFAQKHENIKLLLVGKMGDGSEQILKQIDNSKIKKNIEILGFVPDDQLQSLFARSLAFLFPSKYEGFGMPVLEAMSENVPVIASDIPALREICENSAIFASPYSEDEWLGALESIMDDNVRADLITKGKEQIKKFSWEQTARTTLKVLRNV
jgi:glycosyltransferase involved in cell wall biosynthesis